MLFFSHKLAKGAVKHANGPIRAPSQHLLPVRETGREHQPPCVLPPWTATLELPLPYLWAVNAVNGCEAQLWVSLKSTQRMRTQLHSHCTHSCCSTETQELGTFTSRIYDFRDCPGMSVLSPTTQMRRLRRHWASAAREHWRRRT